jgi:hypothetical protein
MKVLAILLSFLFAFNVSAGSVTALEAAMDEFHYVMTVEWDQKDQDFYNKQVDAFMANLSKIIQREGLTREQILNLAQMRINNSKAFEALKLKLSLLPPAASASELAQSLKEAAKDFYVKGASWSGDVIIQAGLIGLGVFLVGYVIWFHVTHECVQWEEVYSCETENYCKSESWDSWTNSWECTWWQQETTCGYRDVCRLWQKKQ